MSDRSNSSVLFAGSKHAIESLLLALLEANIPSNRLVGALMCAGFIFDEEPLFRIEGCGFSLTQVRRMIRQRIEFAHILYEELCGEYLRFSTNQVDVPHRSEHMTVGDGHLNPRYTESEETIMLHVSQLPWVNEESTKLIRLARLEKALVESVKAGDRATFDAALAS